MVKNKEKSYKEIDIPDKSTFDQTSKEENKYYHSLFCDWFIQKYLFKINECVAKNLGLDDTHTYFKINLPSKIISQYKLFKKNSYDKHRYHLPKLQYDYIKDIWSERGWALSIYDEVYYRKKSGKTIHNISSKTDRLSNKYVIFRISVHNNGTVPSSSSDE